MSQAQEGRAVFGGRIANRKRKFGIYDTEGKALANCDVASSQMRTRPQAEINLDRKYTEIEGPVLFAGMAAQQYGHVLTNSIGRLWALDHLPKDTVLHFLPQRRPFARLYPFLEPVVRALGIENKILLAKAPHKFHQLYTAPEIYGERFGGDGSREFFNWLDRRCWPQGPVTLGRSIYVSRGLLGPKVGRYACEDHLEALLADAGYEIYHPQDHELPHQIATFQDAERLIFAESSAVHLYALLRRPEQTAAIIQRRRDLPQLIERQLFARPGLPVETINAIKAEYWPPIRQDNLSISLLDFDHLRDCLLTAGLLRESDPWSAPSARDEALSLSEMLEPGEIFMDAVDRASYLEQLKQEREVA